MNPKASCEVHSLRLAGLFKLPIPLRFRNWSFTIKCLKGGLIMGKSKDVKKDAKKKPVKSAKEKKDAKKLKKATKAAF
jgi:hypothetical protein